MKKFLLSALVAAIAVTAFLAMQTFQKNKDNDTTAAATPVNGTVAQTGTPKAEVARLYVEPVLK